MRVSFNGSQAVFNGHIPTAKRILEGMRLSGGPILKLKFEGELTLDQLVIIAHVKNLYGVTAVWDENLNKFVVVMTTNPAYKLGDEID